MARKFFVGGNFKMNGSKAFIVKYLADLKQSSLSPNAEVVIGVPFPYLTLAADEAKGSGVEIAAQNSYTKESGAYTGEVSPQMIQDCGAGWVILGHSERRSLFHESSDFIAEKTKFALDSGLSVILCIGETLDEREAGETHNVCCGQLAAAVNKLTPAEWSKVVIAYEPVWAIGTGRTATPADANSVHVALRKYIAKAVSTQVADSVRILYGGSVNAKNAADLGAQSDIDGFLVGGASLKPEFVDIVNSGSKL